MVGEAKDEWLECLVQISRLAEVGRVREIREQAYDWQGDIIPTV